MKHVVFVCVENSCRSQIAEAFGNIHNTGDFEIYSAGSNPSGQVNPKAVETMAELDYDMSSHRSLGLEELPEIEFDAVITMGCGDNCPWLKCKLREDWGLPDPKYMEADAFRVIRNTIDKKVAKLLEMLAK